MLTLWDLLPIRRTKAAAAKDSAQGDVAPNFALQASEPHAEAEPVLQEAPAARLAHGPTAAVHAIEAKPAVGRRRIRTKSRREVEQERYEAVCRELLASYNIRVRKWRRSMSGMAWYVTYADGTVSRLIESPRPKSPLSMAIFLHEVGHHAIGFGVHKPRCLEEYHAWNFAIAEMERRGLEISDAVRERVSKSLRYAVAKARRRKIREIPAELAAYA